MREDWIKVEINESGDIITGGTPSKKIPEYYSKNDYPFYKPTDLNSGYAVKSSTDFLSELGFQNSRNANVNSILVTCIGATIGKTGLIKKQGAFNQQINAIIPNNYILSEFLYFQIIAPEFQEQIKKNASSTTLPILNKSKFSKLLLFVTSLPEQRVIVAKIEELFSDLDKGIKDIKKAQRQLIIYRHAVLKKAFEGGLTKEWREKNPYSLDGFLENLKFEKDKAIKEKLISKSDYFPVFENKDLTYQIPNQWISLPWKTITSNNKYAMKRGPFGSALKKEFFVDEGIVVYEQGHAINDEPFRHRYYITEEKFEELKAFKTKAGDMIISCSGATLGRICLLPENADVGIINQALLKIDLDEKIILKKFFLMLFRSETFQRLIFEKSLGTAMPNMIGMAELKEIPIPIPSIKEQKIIIQEIESRLSVCDKVEQSISESLDKAIALRQSILKKAFEGKLLSSAEIARCKQEKDYEPAAVLLEKIKAVKKNKKVN